jgi:hypothetical protein
MFRKCLTTLALAAGIWSIGVAHAALCTVALPITNPDGSLTHATDCGYTEPMGTSGNGHSPTRTGNGINVADPGNLGLSWTFIDRDPGTETGQIENAFSITGTTSGTWLIDTDETSGFDSFVITLKDGNPISDGFLWFLIDTALSATQCSASQTAGGWDLCGAWSMYGELQGRAPGTPTAHAVSHMDLFGSTQDIIVPPFGNLVPEPSMPLLLSIGLMGLWLVRSRRST